MKLTYGEPTKVDIELIQKHLPEALAMLSKFEMKEFAQARELQISDPIPLYSISDIAIKTKNLIKMAEHIGRQFIVGTAKRKAALTIDVLESKAGETQIGCIRSGTSATENLAAIEFAEQWQEAPENTSEPRILESPSISFSALWLHGKSDWFVPIRDDFDFKEHRVLTESQLIQQLIPIVEAAQQGPSALSVNAEDVMQIIEKLHLSKPAIVGALPANILYQDPMARMEKSIEHGTVEMLWHRNGVAATPFVFETQLPVVHARSEAWVSPPIFLSYDGITNHRGTIENALKSIDKYLATQYRFDPQKHCNITILAETKENTLASFTYVEAISNLGRWFDAVLLELARL